MTKQEYKSQLLEKQKKLLNHLTYHLMHTLTYDAWKEYHTEVLKDLLRINDKINTLEQYDN